MFRLFGLLLVGLVLAGCAEYVAMELAVNAAAAISNNTGTKSSHNTLSSKSAQTVDSVIRNLTDAQVCESAKHGYSKHVQEVKRRGLRCDVKRAKFSGEELSISFVNNKNGHIFKVSEDGKNIFFFGTKNEWFKKVSKLVNNGSRVKIALHLNDEDNCSSLSASYGKSVNAKNTYVDGNKGILIYSNDIIIPAYYSSGSKKYLDLFVKAVPNGTWFCAGGFNVTSSKHTTAWNKLKIAIPKETVIASNNTAAKSSQNTFSSKYVATVDSVIRNLTDIQICQSARHGYPKHKQEAKRRGLNCGVGETSSTQVASSSTTQSNTPISAELLAAQRKAEELEQQLAALKAQQEQQQQTISNDTQIPLITIASANTKGKQGVIRGRASDNVGVAEITASGQPVPFDTAGNFQYQTFVPTGGKDIVIEVTDVAGLTSKQTVSLTRKAGTATAAITFDSLNPLGRRVATNKDALALIIGVDGYENTPARAIYADSDAQMFADYATEKLGIPANRIKTLVNDNADEQGMLLAIKDWLARANRQGKSDIYIFFAGHGLASDDGEKMYLLPYDGSPRLLDRTAILRDELFADISAANPRSVTVFLDTCYSGTTRGTDMLIASRPIAIRALEQSIPDNFTVMTAAAGDQTAKPLEEAKHGMFSYFLMKGMEGEADANNDNEITAGELHSYVQTNVIQQSSGSQTPELQGNADRVLVTFK